MNVLFVLPRLMLAGAEVRTVGVACRLAAEGTRVAVALLRAPEAESLVDRLGQVPLLNASTRGGRIGIRRFCEAKEARQSSVVLHSAMTSAGVVTRALRLTVSAPVVHVHSVTNTLRPNRSGRRSVRDRAASWADARLIHRADLVHAVSDDVAAQLRSRYPPAAHKIHIVADLFVATTTDAAATPGVLARPEVREAGLRLLTLGRLTAHKGQAVLIDALPAILQTRPDAHVIVLGTGPCQAELDRQVRALGVGLHVTFAGETSSPTAFLDWADMLVHTSSHEGLSRACIEAARRSVPLVLANTPAAREHALRCGGARLVPAWHALALARAILDTPTAARDVLGVRHSINSTAGYLAMYRRAVR